MRMKRTRHSNKLPATRWSLIGRAAAAESNVRRAAIAEVVTAYDPALKYFLVCKLRVDEDTAAEITQGFVTDRIIEKGILGRADPARGRVRSFIVRALYNYAMTWLERSRRHKGISLDALPTAAEAAIDDPLLKSFDRQWARNVLWQAVDAMHKECLQKSRNDIWEIFRVRVVEPAKNGTEPMDYDRLVERFGFSSPREAIHRLATGVRMLKRHLKQIVGQYTHTDEQVEQELLDLRDAFA
ncbi:MAG: hypothetical protein ABSB42_10260 [Tepidisphaeraceae bacterium]